MGNTGVAGKALNPRPLTMEGFTISMLVAQISDLHIGKPDGRTKHSCGRAAALRQCVEALNVAEPPVDLVLITGDLVNDGVAEEYRHVRKLLAPLRMPYFVVPGNHDDRETMRSEFSDHLYLPRKDDFLHYAIEDYPLRLIGLDSIIPGEARGELCARRIEWLAHQLATQPRRPTLLFLHHPPFLDGIRFWDVLNCRNSGELAGLVRSNAQIVGIVAGHLHQSMRRLWNGVMASSSPSPAQALALTTRQSASRAPLNPPFFHLHEWDALTGLVSRPGFVARQPVSS